MYNLMEELKILKKRLEEQNDFQGSQAVSQALVRIDNLTYDVHMYKQWREEGLSLGIYKKSE